MFTGIIKAIGTVKSIGTRGGDSRLSVTSAGLPWGDFDVGESIAVNGVCLTAAELHDDGFDADVSKETLKVTALGSVEVGSRVNLEPSISFGERLGGHLVSGHVDCVGVIEHGTADARSTRLDVQVPAEYSRYIAKKGSVCIDGVSLTVNEVSDNGFSVNIIPHTAEVTIIGGYVAGTRVNIEVDLVARYLERLLAMGDESGITKEFLRANGYV